MRMVMTEDGRAEAKPETYTHPNFESAKFLHDCLLKQCVHTRLWKDGKLIRVVPRKPWEVAGRLWDYLLEAKQ